jgi:hypothetical protein
LQLQYEVAAQAIERDGKKYTLIEIIDESECKNKWRINPAGKAHALAGLFQTPLLGPPEYGHGAIDVVGRPVDFESNFHTHVLYEMPNPADWEKVWSGEWRAVSPQLSFLKYHYEGDTLVIDEWRFDHVAFVDSGAFPNAGVKSTCEGDPVFCGFSNAVTAALTSHGLEPEGSKPRQDVAAYSDNRQGDREKTRGHHHGGVIVKNTGTKEVDTMPCEHDKVIAELTEKNKTLEAQLAETKTKTIPAAKQALDKVECELKTVKAENEALKSKPVEANVMMATLQEDVKNLKAENATLKAWKAEREEAEHMNRVQAVLDLRVKTGRLDSKAVQAAANSLKKLPNEALDEIRGDLEAMLGKFESLPAGPKAKLIPSSVAARFNPMQPTVGDLVGKKLGEA